jgi:NAD-dependent DNA ligase
VTDSLDEHGQPPRRFYAARIQDRAIQEMLGLIKGVVCDGVITDEECKAFTRWMIANDDAVQCWPGNILAERIVSIFADGMIDKDERHNLYELFCDTVGDGGSREALRVNYSTRLPFDEPVPQIQFPDRTFVLTGQFVYGPRAKCEAEITQRGGRCRDRIVKDPHTVVVGTIASRAWIQSDWGRKIEKAVEYRDAGAGVQIVSEETWTGALGSRPPLKLIR